jgi:hypothetical protein
MPVLDLTVDECFLYSFELLCSPDGCQLLARPNVFVSVLFPLIPTQRVISCKGVNP